MLTHIPMYADQFSRPHTHPLSLLPQTSQESEREGRKAEPQMVAIRSCRSLRNLGTSVRCPDKPPFVYVHVLMTCC